MKPLFKHHYADLINHIFQLLLVTYLVLLLAEQVWTGSVSIYLNLNWLLVIVIVAGIFDVFSEHPDPEKKKIKKSDYVFIIILGILGFVIIKFKTIELGWLSWVISIIAGILIILLSLLVLEDDEDKEKPKKSEKSKFTKHRYFLGVVLVLAVLMIISALISIFSEITFLESMRIIYGSVYVLFLPGFILSYVFFPKTKEFDAKEREKGAIDWIERIALSFALSIAVVPLAVFYLNLIGIKINLLNSFLTILGIIIISSIILFHRIKKLKN